MKPKKWSIITSKAKHEDIHQGINHINKVQLCWIGLESLLRFRI